MSNDDSEPYRGKRSLRPVMLVMAVAAAAIGIIFAVLALLGAIFTAVSERGEKIVGAIYLPSDLSEGQVGILLGMYGAGLALVLGMLIHHVRTPTHRLQLALWGVVFFCLPVAILFLPVTGQELTESGGGLLSYSYYVEVDCGSWFRRVSGVDMSVCQPEFESVSRIAMAFAAMGIAVPLAILVWETIIEKREGQEPNPP